MRRANELADECGRLNYQLARARDENNELLAENAQLRRRLDK